MKIDNNDRILTLSINMSQYISASSGADISHRVKYIPRKCPQKFIDYPVLKEGHIIQLSSKNKMKKRYLFLTTNHILICKPSKQNKSGGTAPCTVRWVIRLRKPKSVSEVQDSSYKNPDAEFRLYANTRTFIFFIPDGSNYKVDRDSWVQQINQQFA